MRDNTFLLVSTEASTAIKQSIQRKGLTGLRWLAVLWMITATAAVHSTSSSTVLVVGDSISAAYGIASDDGWVALLRERLAPRGWQVVNASISGDTTGGGRARLPMLLEKHRPAVVVIELGGNDGLRGHPIKTLRANLLAMTEASRASGAQVLLAGMEIPPNYGPQYTRAFRESFQVVAQATDSAWLPFLLDGVATDPEQMQADGIHPRANAQARILQNLMPYLEPLLAEASTDISQAAGTP